MNWVRKGRSFRIPVPAGRRARLLLAGVVALGTAVPLILSAPGGPGTSFLRVAAPLPLHTDSASTTTTTLPAPAAPAKTTPTTAAGNSSARTTPLPQVSSPTTTTRQTSAPRTTLVIEPTTPPTSPAPPGAIVMWCTASQLGLSVATNRPSYLPGDTIQINLDAVNRSNAGCVLSDPTRANPPASTCQPDTLIEAPYNATFPGLPVVADLGPPCNGDIHGLAAGDAWRTSLVVSIPSDGSWSPGTYTVHSEWQALGQLVSADTSFDLGGSTTTTTTTPPTTLPPLPTTTTIP